MILIGFAATGLVQAQSPTTHYYSVNDGSIQQGNYNNDSALGTGSMAVGVGARTTSATTWGTAIGNGALADGDRATAIGSDAQALANSTLALGQNAYAASNPQGVGLTATALGAASRATAEGALAVGNQAQASGVTTTAIGSQAGFGSSGRNNTFVGAVAGRGSSGNRNFYGGPGAGWNTTGDVNVTIGLTAGAYAKSANYMVAIGSGALQSSSGSYNTALGEGAGFAMNGSSNIAIGLHAAQNVRANQTISLGTQATAAATNAIAIGSGAQATGYSSLSIGTGNIVTGAKSGAIGDPNMVSGTGSYAIGNNNTIAQNNTFVLGNSVTTTQANSVVLGNQSADKAAVQVNSADIPGVTATLNPDGTVSYSAGPTISYSGFAGTASGVVSVGAAGAERQIVNVAPGAITATSTDAVNGSQLYSIARTVSALGGNITTLVNNAQTHYYSVNDGGTRQANYANDGATGKFALAAGVGATAVGQSSVAIGDSAIANNFGDVSVGMQAGFAAGGGQYNLAIGSQAGQGAIGTHNTAVGNGALTGAKGNANVGLGAGSAYQVVGDGNTALGAASGRLVHGNNNVALGSKAGNGVSANDTVSIGSDTTVVADGGVALGAGAASDRAGMNGQREAFSNVSVQSTQGAVSVGRAGSERQITNVAGGTANTDAVNVRQLRAVQQQAVNYDTNPDGTVNYNHVTLGNGQAPGGTVISNVAPGTAGTDAVNVNQLNTGIASANTYTDARVGALQNNIHGVARRAYAGVASAMAMESAPYIAGKTTYSVGAGHYQGQTALAVTLRRTADNGRWSVTGGLAGSAGGVAARVGVAGVLD